VQLIVIINLAIVNSSIIVVKLAYRSVLVKYVLVSVGPGVEGCVGNLTARWNLSVQFCVSGLKPLRLPASQNRLVISKGVRLQEVNKFFFCSNSTLHLGRCGSLKFLFVSSPKESTRTELFELIQILLRDSCGTFLKVMQVLLLSLQ